MSNRRVALGGAGLAVAGIVAWVYLRRDEAPATPVATGSGAGSAAGTPTDPRTARDPDHAAPPAIASGDPGELGSGSGHEYAVGNVNVRDHRSGDNAPMDVPPNIHRPEGRTLPSPLTHAISQRLRQVMMDCATALPRDARGAAPRLEGQIIVAIHDHKLAISKSTMLLRDVQAAAVDATKSCIEQKSIGLDVAAPDEADVDDYSINITFAMP